MEDFHGGGSTETVIIALCGLPAEIIQAKKEKQTVCQLFQSFFINSGGDRHLHGEETLSLRGFFFSNFFRDCFHRRSRDSGKWRGIASNVFHNDPRSASGSGKVGFLFARRFLKFILRERGFLLIREEAFLKSF